MDLLKDLRISLLKFNFVMIYIIHKILVLLQNDLNFKCFLRSIIRSISFMTYDNKKFKL